MGQSASALQLLRQGLPERDLLTRLAGTANVDLTAKDDEERGALHYAAASGYANLAVELISRGVDPDQKDVNGDTALHTAAFKNHPNVLAVLIKQGCDLNVQDSSGMTALHWAVRENNLECVDILVAANAELGIRNDRDQTPIDAAVTLKRKHREEMLLRLRRHPAYLEVSAHVHTSGSPRFPPARKMAHKDRTAGSNISNANAEAAVATQHQKRMMALCSLWGLVKYTHPYVAYRAEVNWDKALLDALVVVYSNKADGKEASEDEFSKIVSDMLAQLHDPNTRVVSAKEHSRAQAAAEPPADGESPPAPRPQPFVELTKDKVAVVVLTDYEQFSTTETADQKMEQMVNAFASAASAGSAIIFDVRYVPQHSSQGSEPLKGSQQLGFIFAEAFRSFLQDDLPLPTLRQRLFTGLPEHKRAYASAFQHGFFVQDGDILPRSAYPDQFISLAVPTHPHHGTGHQAQKPLCFLLSRHSPQIIIDIALAMRSRGQAVYIFQASDDEDYRVRPHHSGAPGNSASPLEYLVYEPNISASVFQLPDAENIKVFVRQNERVCPDATIGFHPDCVIVAGKASATLTSTPSPQSPSKGNGIVTPSSGILSASAALENDAAVRVGVEFCTGRRPVPRQRLVYPNFNVKRVEDEYRDSGAFPPLEQRILALFRLWNAVQYFFPYKPLMDSAWDELLLSHLHEFENASDATQYHIAVARIVRELCDTHAFVRSNVLSNHIGAAVPPVKITTVKSGEQLEATVTHVANANSPLQVGDVILSVDEVPTDARRCAVMDLFAASTPQAAIWRADLKLLAGELNSTARLSVRRQVGDTSTVSEVDIVRSLTSPVQAGRDTLRTFQLLESADKQGNKIGWIDLTRLSFAEVDAAVECVSGASSIILDVRGYTKGTIYRLGPMLASSSAAVACCETPAMMPTLLSDDLQVPTLKSVQASVVPHSSSVIPASTKVVALVNEETLSHGEYAVSFLRAVRPNLVLVGSATNGALGNITNIALPGGIQVGFSGMGMTTPDGVTLQRRGLSPDVSVEPSVASITAGKDVVLEKAVEFLCQ